MRKSEDTPMAGGPVVDVPGVIALIEATATEVNVDTNILFCINGQKGGTIAQLAAAIEHIMIQFSPGSEPEPVEKGDKVQAVDLGIEGGYCCVHGNEKLC